MDIEIIYSHSSLHNNKLSNIAIHEMKPKKQKTDWGKMTPLFALIISVAGLIFATSMFFIGYHNSDLAQNMRWLEAEYGMTLLDQASDFNFYTSNEGLIMGNNQMRTAFILVIMFAMIFGMALADINGVPKQ